MNDITFLPAISMAKQVRKKKISPVELVDAHLAKIERLNPKLNAYVQLDADGARLAAHNAEADIMRENSIGPLHGVPISIKSSISVAGLRCEAGTRLRAGFVAQQDAPLVTRLKNAGAIILGMDQHARTPHGLGNRQPSLRPHQQPVEPGANPRRFQRR